LTGQLTSISSSSFQGAFLYNTSSIGEGNLLSANGTITEIRMNNTGSANFTISNTDQQFSILNTSANSGVFTSGTTLLQISNSGNVGIGKTSSSYGLDVSGNIHLNDSGSNNSQRLLFGSYSAGQNITAPVPNKIDLYNQSGQYGFGVGPSAINYATSSYHNFYLGCSSTIVGYIGLQIYIDTSNNSYVGINKLANSSYTLDVSGNANFSGQVTAHSFNSTSDYRLKTNIKEIDNYSVDKLNPIQYDINGKHDMGFLAHEVQEHFPFLIDGEKDGEKMQSINYTGFIALLVKEIKQLKKKVAILEAK
jgi:hypothetical protein